MSGNCGPLLLEIPRLIASRVVPYLRQFMDSNPLTELRVHLVEVTDFAAHGSGVCRIRIADKPSHTEKRLKVGAVDFVCCAASRYLELYGIPHTLADLQHHRAVNVVSRRTFEVSHWHFSDDGKIEIVRVHSGLDLDNSDAAVDAALAGLGLLQTVLPCVQTHIVDGGLIEVLPEYRPPQRPVYIHYDSDDASFVQIKAFLEWLIGKLAL